MPADVGLLGEVSRLALFDGLDESELAALLPTLQEVSYNEGEWIVRRGETDVPFHIIVEGEGGVILDDEELAVLSKGSFFGEISALLDEPTVADVVARKPLRCLLVPAAEVKAFLLANAHVMYRILQTEARRVRTTDELRL